VTLEGQLTRDSNTHEALYHHNKNTNRELNLTKLNPLTK